MLNTKVITRFAPSPTGAMHFGNLRTALFNYLFAKSQLGSFLLRIEDTDTQRSKQIYSDMLQNELKNFGLNWEHGPFYQLKRLAIYEEYYKKLNEEKKIYPCFCPEEKLILIRKSQLAAGQPPRYPGTCRNLTDSEINNKLNSGQRAAWRFHVPNNATIEFIDLFKGKQRFLGKDLGDFIVKRNEGIASFMFANAIDDSLMGVTHVLRGDDHLTNTPRQLLILEALQLRTPLYGHFPMIVGADDTKLSKRHGSSNIKEWQDLGYHPLAILNYLYRLGHYLPDNKCLSLKLMTEKFKTNSINNSPAKHDIQHLKYWQKEAILSLSEEELYEYLRSYLPANTNISNNSLKLLILSLKNNILMPQEIIKWYNIFFKELTTWQDEQIEILLSAGSSFFNLASEIITKDITYEIWLQQVKDKTTNKGKKLFLPLRIALTGIKVGPELVDIFNLLSADVVKQRLLNALTFVLDKENL